MSFTELIKKASSSSLQWIDMSSSMDLMLTISVKGLFSLIKFGKGTWEKIIVKKSNEIHSKPEALLVTGCFDFSSQFISLGFSDGSIYLFHIELSLFRQCYRFTLTSNQSSISSIRWYSISVKPSLELRIKLSESGGIDLVSRAGMLESNDPLQNDDVSFLKSLDTLKSTILIVLNKDWILFAYILGIYPTFCISLATTPSTSNSFNLMKSIPIHTNRSDQIFFPFAQTSNPRLHNPSSALINNILTSPNIFSKYYLSFERSGQILTWLQYRCQKVQSIMNSLAKKWKECTKVIQSKMSILQELLEKYELTMNPIEFYYTITMCGMWHPGAGITFTQHWNDQGITRLKSSIDSTSKTIIRMLFLEVIPMVTNMFLDSSELLNLINSLKLQDTDRDPSNHSNPFDPLVFRYQTLHRNCERLLIKVQETLLEAKLARERMLLFIMFIKDCTIEINPTGTNPTKSNTSIEKYQELFDPRIPRPPITGPLAQSESATATYLYAQLLTNHGDGFELPPEYLLNRLGRTFHAKEGGMSMNSSAILRQVPRMNEANEINEIFEMIETFAEDTQYGQSKLSTEGKEPYRLSDVEKEKVKALSLSTQIKNTLDDITIAYSMQSDILSRIWSEEDVIKSAMTVSEDEQVGDAMGMNDIRINLDQSFDDDVIVSSKKNQSSIKQKVQEGYIQPLSRIILDHPIKQDDLACTATLSIRGSMRLYVMDPSNDNPPILLRIHDIMISAVVWTDSLIILCHESNSQMNYVCHFNLLRLVNATSSGMETSEGMKATVKAVEFYSKHEVPELITISNLENQKEIIEGDEEVSLLLIVSVANATAISSIYLYQVKLPSVVFERDNVDVSSAPLFYSPLHTSIVKDERKIRNVQEMSIDESAVAKRLLLVSEQEHQHQLFSSGERGVVTCLLHGKGSQGLNYVTVLDIESDEFEEDG